ncbi:hypothetical protein BD410DRAFT_810401 [Rickenella mellea]|uniref:Uncharacterized protein n=1 Tax=Rickenella mellea TaxID=50990 RepID=A0A4Y7PF08_9AGAM|nr:hypothetical protein BD410DRAFT_810401 [Rickenella mellea]
MGWQAIHKQNSFGIPPITLIQADDLFPVGTAVPNGYDRTLQQPHRQRTRLNCSSIQDSDYNVPTGTKRKSCLPIDLERPAKCVTLTLLSVAGTTTKALCCGRRKMRNRSPRKITPLYSCPTELLRAITLYLTPPGEIPVQELRALVQVSPYFLKLYKAQYWLAVQFVATPLKDSSSVDIKLLTTSSFDGLMVWRRSAESFMKIRQLSICLSPQVDTATYETELLWSFFLSLPQQLTPHIERLFIIITGPERYQLVRLMGAIHKAGIQRMKILTHLTSGESPMALSSISSVLSGLEEIKIDHLPGLIPLRSWLFSSIISSASTVRCLMLTNLPMGVDEWEELLLSMVTFPALKECKFELTITFDILMSLVQRHPLIQSIRVLDSSREQRKEMNLLGGGQKVALPELRDIEGPAEFIVSILNFLQFHPPQLFRIRVHTSGHNLSFLEVDRILGRMPRSITTLHFELGTDTNCRSFANTKRKRVERNLRNVEHLVISRNSSRPLEGKAMDHVVEWISLFPRLLSVMAFVNYPKREVFTAKLLRACRTLTNEMLKILYQLLTQYDDNTHKYHGTTIGDRTYSRFALEDGATAGGAGDNASKLTFRLTGIQRNGVEPMVMWEIERTECEEVMAMVERVYGSGISWHDGPMEVVRVPADEEASVLPVLSSSSQRAIST